MRPDMNMKRDRGLGTHRVTAGKGLEPFMEMAKKIMTGHLGHETRAGCEAAMIMLDLAPTNENVKATHMFFTGMEFGMAQAMKMIAEGSLDMKVVGIDKPCDTDDSQ